MASPIRPQFFCSRPNGTLTPMIALDELPAHVTIRGVPRVLSPSETQGMTSLGTVSPRAQFYVVDGVSPGTSRASNGHQSAQHVPRDVELQNSLLKVVTDDTIPASQRLALHALIQQGLSQNWVMSNPAAGAWLASHTGRQGPHYNTKKEFCSYWIRHGECDYQQQGCLYKHEMPTDPAMLEKLGLRDIPRWYREKYGLPSLLPAGHQSSRAHSAHGQHWKDSDVPSRGAFKAIQYPSRSGVHEPVSSASAAARGTDLALKQEPVGEYPQAEHQPAINTTQAQTRPSYGTANFPKVYPSHKQATKQVPSQQNGPTKKIDLLSFDPLHDYPNLDPIGGESTYSTAPATAAEEADRAHREGLVRSLQSLVPSPVSGTPDLLPSPLDSTSCQIRNKRQQQPQQPRSRRLYQPRSPAIPEPLDQNAIDVASFKNRHSSVATLSSPASIISKSSTQMTSPLAGPVLGNGDVHSDPPTRMATPSIHSQSSSSSGSVKKASSGFPRTLGNRARPNSIGTTRKGNRKRSAEPLHGELINLGAAGRGK